MVPTLADRPLDLWFSSSLENLRAIGAGFAADHSAKAEAVAAAHRSLVDELTDALLNDPQRKVSAPAFSESNAPVITAAQVVADMFSGRGGEQSLHDLLRVLGGAAKGEDVQLQAKLLVRVLAVRHATAHAADAVAAA